VLKVRRWRELVVDRKNMEGYFSTGQSPQWAVVSMEEEGGGGEKIVRMKNKLRAVQLVHNIPGVYVSALWHYFNL